MGQRYTRDLPDAIEDLAEEVLDAAFEVHSSLGPGLLEHAYKSALAHELRSRGLHVTAEAPVSLCYKGHQLGTIYRLDLLIEDQLIVELKAVQDLAPVHGAQVLTYLQAAQLPLGLLLNFGARKLRHGIRRLIRSEHA